jgi:heme/copper-type cytochrome/quinol oxidase subunit 2
MDAGVGFRDSSYFCSNRCKNSAKRYGNTGDKISKRKIKELVWGLIGFAVLGIVINWCSDDKKETATTSPQTEQTTPAPAKEKQETKVEIQTEKPVQEAELPEAEIKELDFNVQKVEESQEIVVVDSVNTEIQTTTDDVKETQEKD